MQKKFYLRLNQNCKAKQKRYEGRKRTTAT